MKLSNTNKKKSSVNFKKENNLKDASKKQKAKLSVLFGMLLAMLE